LKDLTPLQETVLTILYLSEKLANYPQMNDRKFYASGRFFLYLNGMVFESYHRKMMRQLEKLGWIHIITFGGVLYYALTKDGMAYKDAHKDLANRCAIPKYF
jgi:hypothetical protein